MTHTVTIEEEERQLVLLALAVLALRSPGFDYALNEIACKMDNVEEGRAVTYDRFKEARRAQAPEDDEDSVLDGDDGSDA